MTDAQLQGIFWPTLNPDYRLDPKANTNSQPVDRMFDSVYYKDLTPEFLVRECIKRGWRSLPDRLNWYKETETGWNAECRLGDGQWTIYSVRAENGHEAVDG